MEEKVEANITSSYAEEQQEQFVKVVLAGTGAKGECPATHIKIEAKNTNDFQKFQAFLHMFEWLDYTMRKRDTTLSDMIYEGMKALYDKEKGAEDGKNN